MSQGGAGRKAFFDTLRNALGGEAWRQREMLKASLTWLQL